MKKTILALALLAMTATAFASLDCQDEALEIAKTNLDSKARAYGFSESDILADSFTQVEKTSETQTLSVGGGIYKAEYEIVMRLDSLCSLETLSITEIGAQ